MVRDDLKTKTSLKHKIVGYALLNIIPIGGLLWFAWGLTRGDIALDDLPRGLDRTGVFLGVTIALLFVVVTFLLPASHVVAKRVGGSLTRSAEIRSSAGLLRLAGELILWPFRQVIYRVSWVLRFVLYFVSLALILLAVVFIIRFFEPEFGEQWLPLDDYLQRAVDWLRARGAR